jgi:hypothetical protein
VTWTDGGEVLSAAVPNFLRKLDSVSHLFQTGQPIEWSSSSTFVGVVDNVLLVPSRGKAQSQLAFHLFNTSHVQSSQKSRLWLSLTFSKLNAVVCPLLPYNCTSTSKHIFFVYKMTSANMTRARGKKYLGILRDQISRWTRET